MGFSRKYLPWMACAAIAATVLPALAWGQDPPSSASIVVTDYAFRDAAGTDSTVEIAPGGTVHFSYPTGMSRHNVVFVDQAADVVHADRGRHVAPGAAAALVHAGPRLGRRLRVHRGRARTSSAPG